MNKVFILLILLCTFIIIGFSEFKYSTERIGGTQLNGSGCVCHTVEESQFVKTWVTGPDTLTAGETGYYKMFLTGGPAIAGGYNVAGRFGTMGITDSLSKWDYRAPNELTQAFPLQFPTPADTIFWAFSYTASDSSAVDTIYSTGLSVNFDGNPSDADQWSYGPKFPITIINSAVPVELISFDAQRDPENIILKWTTATEVNNKGFQVEKRIDGSWLNTGFVNGAGTSSDSVTYTFKDFVSAAGTIGYRLKQIDYDGSYNYSKVIEVDVNNPGGYHLFQNFPNPFNPDTKIRYTIPETAKSERVNVKLTIYDINGREISILLNEPKTPGVYETNFQADGLSSGIYFYKLEAGNFNSVKKMVYLK